MKKIVSFAVMTCSFLSFSLYAAEPVIYGKDGRIEVYEASPMIQKLARSTALQIPHSSIIPLPNGKFDLSQNSLKMNLEKNVKSKADAIATTEAQGAPEESKSRKILPIETYLINNKAVKKEILVCEEEKFQEQPTPGNCSGFLVAPDLLMTAGHCMNDVSDCTNFAWVFDFKIDKVTQTAGQDFDINNIYSCKSIRASALIRILNLDYALVQLDRPVIGREPLEFRKEGKIKTGTEIFVIGGPSGLPTKVAGGANVRGNDLLNRFSANLDTYGGNSGSAVFDAKTGLVEGILVEGEDDYLIDETRGCIQSNQCADGGCMGENITRIMAVPEIALQKVFNEAAMSGDLETINDVLKFKLWIDYYGKDGQSALIKAATYHQDEVLNLLIQNKANVNLKDVNGDTALHFLARDLNVSSINSLVALIVGNANLEAQNKYKDTPLHVAAEKLNLIGVELLIAGGANINALDINGETILFQFAKAGNQKAYIQLLKLGVDATIKNKDGYTARFFLDN